MRIRGGAQARVPVPQDKKFMSPTGQKRASLGATSFEELQAYGLGYLKSAAQAECYRVFDKKVERASREMKRGLWPE
jgi:hypothetical protein